MYYRNELPIHGQLERHESGGIVAYRFDPPLQIRKSKQIIDKTFVF